MTQLGLSQEQLVGRTPREVLDAATGARATAHFGQALAGEQLTFEYTYAERMLWTHYTALRDEGGRIWAAMALVLDITARKRLEAQLLQAQKMESVGQLAGGIAHDFNNLLAAISGYAAFALEAPPPDAPVHADIAEIQRASDRAAALNRQLLAFARRQRLESSQSFSRGTRRARCSRVQTAGPRRSRGGRRRCCWPRMSPPCAP